MHLPVVHGISMATVYLVNRREIAQYMELRTESLVCRSITMPNASIPVTTGVYEEKKSSGSHWHIAHHETRTRIFK